MPNIERRYVSLVAATEYASCSSKTLRKLIAEGRLTGYRLGRSIRIDLNELDAYMDPRSRQRVNG